MWKPLLFFLLLLPFCLVGEETSPPLSPKMRMPEWRLQVSEYYDDKNPKEVHFYEENERGEEKLAKKVYFYPSGSRSQEIDFTFIREEDFAEKTDYEQRKELWKSQEVPHGISMSFFETGKMQSIVCFDRGLLYGEAKTFYPKGQPQYVASYKDGQLEGLATRYYENGEIISQGMFQGGSPIGTHLSYYENGTRKILVPYNEQGKIDGEVFEWYESGVEKERRLYKEGTLSSAQEKHAIVKYGEKHEVIEIQDFRDGVPIGEHLQYYPSGKKSYFVSYVDGKKEGKEQWFGENGELLGEFFYRMGKPTGKQWKKHPNGELSYLAIYDSEGNLTEPIVERDEKGQKILEYTKDLEGQYHDRFTQWHPNGEIAIQCFYKHGVLEGERKEFTESGQLKFLGNYDNGEKNGLFNEWYENGRLSWKGMFKGGKEEGDYIAFYENGQCKTKYHYKDSLPDGVQREWYPDGSKKFEGSFKEGKQDQMIRGWDDNHHLLFERRYHQGEPVGKHVRYFKDTGKLHELAHFRNGKLHGKREVYYPDGALQVSEVYVDGNLDGKVQHFYEDGSLRFSGIYQKGVRIKSHRSFFSPKETPLANEVICEESFYNSSGKLEGEQKAFYSNGMIKGKASYKDGKIHGTKSLWAENGELLQEAEYVEGKLEGRHFTKEVDGASAIYHYKQNKKDGEHIIYYPKQREDAPLTKALEATFSRNKLDGVMTKYNVDGKKVEMITYKEGEQNGPAYLFHSNQRVMIETNFADGKQHGSFYQYFPNGKKQKEATFIEGQKEGEEITYFEDGSTQSIYCYSKGKLHGPARHWNASHVLIFEGEYVDGQLHGSCVKYYDDGKVRLRQSFVRGILNGVKESYDLEGNVEKVCYKNGVKQPME